MIQDNFSFSRKLNEKDSVVREDSISRLKALRISLTLILYFFSLTSTFLHSSRPARSGVERNLFVLFSCCGEEFAVLNLEKSLALVLCLVTAMTELWCGSARERFSVVESDA